MKSRKALFLVSFYLILILGIEVFARGVYFVANDFYPYFVVYGLVASTDWHSSEAKGYSKSQPHSIYHAKTGDQVYEKSINGDGFRGPREFLRPTNRTVLVLEPAAGEGE